MIPFLVASIEEGAMYDYLWKLILLATDNDVIVAEYFLENLKVQEYRIRGNLQEGILGVTAVEHACGLHPLLRYSAN